MKKKTIRLVIAGRIGWMMGDGEMQFAVIQVMVSKVRVSIICRRNIPAFATASRMKAGIVGLFGDFAQDGGMPLSWNNRCCMYSSPRIY
jgi:hypothetical protein